MLQFPLQEQVLLHLLFARLQPHLALHLPPIQLQHDFLQGLLAPMLF
jgi:hypothetical protein